MVESSSSKKCIIRMRKILLPSRCNHKFVKSIKIKIKIKNGSNMEVNIKPVYFKITPDGLEKTKDRNERSSFKQILVFFQDNEKLESDSSQKFIEKWDTIKKNFHEKKLEARYGLIGVIIRLFYRLFSGNQNTIVSELDAIIEKHKVEKHNVAKKDLPQQNEGEEVLPKANLVKEDIRQENVVEKGLPKENLAKKDLPKDDFTLALEEWLNDPKIAGDKQKAVDNIIDCKNNQNFNLLDLRNLSLTGLPDCITEILHLEELYLSGNALKSLPENIGKLVNLRRLDLNRNKLKEIPQSIGDLVKLNFFDPSNNDQLEHLPAPLGNIPGLTLIPVNNTSITKKSVKAILSGCKEQRQTFCTKSLPLLLQKWTRDKDDERASRLVEDLNQKLKPEKKIQLYDWLINLENNKDFAKNQNEFLQKTAQILDALTKSETFRKDFFSLIYNNRFTNATDADSPYLFTLEYNEIYTQYSLDSARNNPSQSERDEFLLILKVARTQALVKILSERIREYESENGLEQEKEKIYLHYLNSLKEQGLFLAIEDMDYKNTGKRDWINEENLIHPLGENIIGELVNLYDFELLLNKNEDFTQELMRLTQEKEGAIENCKDDLNSYKMSSDIQQKFLIDHNELLQNYALKLIALTSVIGAN